MSSSPNILIVDDEISIRDSLSEFFTDYNFNVCSTGNAEDALDYLEKASYDLGLIDLRLPGMSGESFILKAKAIRPQMRFLIYTGSVGYCLPQPLKDIGMSTSHIIRKPIHDLASFVHMIKALIETEFV